MKPFSYINPCGYTGLKVTQTSELGIQDDMQTLSNKLQRLLIKELDKLATH